MSIIFTGPHIKWGTTKNTPTASKKRRNRTATNEKNKKPVAAAIRRKQKFKTRLAEILQTLEVRPKAFITFTLDKSVREELKTEEQLSLFAKLKKQLSKLYPESQGSFFIWVYGYSWHAGVHMHIAARFRTKGQEKILSQLKRSWEEITGVAKDNLVHATRYDSAKHLGYLVSRKKDDEILLLIEQIGRSRACGVLHRSNLQHYPEQKFDFPNQTRTEMLAILTKWVAAKKLPQSTLAQFKKSKGSLAFLPKEFSDKLLKRIQPDDR